MEAGLEYVSVRHCLESICQPLVGQSRSLLNNHASSFDRIRTFFFKLFLWQTTLQRSSEVIHLRKGEKDPLVLTICWVSVGDSFIQMPLDD
jgi:hypothetical protein